MPTCRNGSIRPRTLRITALSALLSVIAPISAFSGTLADRLIQYHHQSCSEQNYLGSDLRLESRYPSPSTVSINAESYYKLNVVGQQGYAEVLMLGGRCDSDEIGYCGSAGCLGYIIFENLLVFEFLGGNPYVANTENTNRHGDLIIFPRAPRECQEHAVPGLRPSSISNCYGLVYWDGTTVTDQDLLRPILVPESD